MNTEDPDVADTIDPTAVHAPGDRPAPIATAAAPPGARRRRPEPARTAPHRHAATLLRASAPGAGQPASAAADEAGAGAEGPVALGVRLGYQVIEEQILQGQKLARRLGRKASQVAGTAASRAGTGPDPAADPGAAPGESRELIERTLHLYKELGALCLDAVETLARNPVVRAGVARLTHGAAAAPAAQAHGAAGAPGGGFALDIRCSRRTQVTLDLRPHAGAGVPRVHALHASDASVPPLTGVRFLPGVTPAEPVLQLAIADTQPAATYTGVVVDGASNEPRGTLVVRVLPPGA